MKIFVLTTLFVIIAAATAAEAGVSSAISKSTQHDIDEEEMLLRMEALP